jgi:hypothetical protein
MNQIIKDHFSKLAALFTPGSLLQNKVNASEPEQGIEKDVASFALQIKDIAEKLLQELSGLDFNILEEANKLTAGARREDYGDAYEACRKIAWMWEAILGAKVRAEDIPLMMICFKVVRESAKHKRDNVVDIAGYARVLEMVIAGKS